MYIIRERSFVIRLIASILCNVFQLDFLLKTKNIRKTNFSLHIRIFVVKFE